MKTPKNPFPDSPVRVEGKTRIYPRLGGKGGGPRIPPSPKSIAINRLLAMIVSEREKLSLPHVVNTATNFFRAIRYLRRVLFRHSTEELQSMTKSTLVELFLETYKTAIVWERRNIPENRGEKRLPTPPSRGG